jgi:LmbE family N-acetylglucosaminyl deacetylase
MRGPILLVFAHPDEESTSLAGTVLKYTGQGVAVDLICATRGEKGTRLGLPADNDTGTAREAELRAAAAMTGIRNIYLLGYIDGELHSADANEIANKVIEVTRKVQPEIVITFGPDGISGHRDHVTIGKAATIAFQTLVDQDRAPRKLYYVTIPDSFVSNASELGIATRPDNEVTTAIDIADYIGVKIQVMATYKSQQDAREFVKMLQENKESRFATTESLYLAIPRISGKETDLFQ